MLVEEVTFRNEEVTLKGTLTKPDATRPYPVVVVAHTSNAGTRDFGVYQHLANALSAHCIAVFLFDRRGAGESTGEFETATFFDLASDVQAAIDILKVRSDIAPDYIGVWGMSQGGWIAPLTASESADVAFVIAVSAVGVSPAEQMNYSAEYALRETGFSEEAIDRMLVLRALVDGYYRGEADFAVVQGNLNLVRDEAWFPLAYLDDTLPETPAQTKWYQEMDFDPLPIIQRVDVPVLLLYGESDPWVPVERSIARWTEFAPKNVTIRQIKDANHFMISIAESGVREDEGRIVDEYTQTLTHWIMQQLESNGT